MNYDSTWQKYSAVKFHLDLEDVCQNISEHFTGGWICMEFSKYAVYLPCVNLSHNIYTSHLTMSRKHTLHKISEGKPSNK